MQNPLPHSPDWECLDHTGLSQTSTSLAGSWYILYFYPKDDTPGCTIEACGFRDIWPTISKAVQIFGVSSDSAVSHQSFIHKYSLPFTLLVDTDSRLRSAFKADGSMYPSRTTFLIDPQGQIQKVYHGFDCNDHASDILRDLQKLHVL